MATWPFDAEQAGMCYNPHLRISREFKEKIFKVFLRSKLITTFCFLVIALTASAVSLSAQANSEKTAKPTPTPNAKFDFKNLTADQLIEISILSYSNLGGRALLNQIRKTTTEKGTSTITSADGKSETANYSRSIIRGETLGKEKIWLELEFPSARYSLISNDGKIFGIFNNSVFTPREDAARGFENQVVRSIDALLRYKENESRIEMAERKKVDGVDYYIVDLTDKQDRKTRYFISAKSYRIMMLTYDEDGVKYRRRFYDYNTAQGTLVPFRTVLWAGDKQVEESEVGTVTYGQKVDEELFKSN